MIKYRIIIIVFKDCQIIQGRTTKKCIATKKLLNHHIKDLIFKIKNDLQYVTLKSSAE